MGKYLSNAPIYSYARGRRVPYVFVGPLNKNPDFKARNWSIGIASADDHERQTLETNLREVKVLAEGVRLLTLKESETLIPALQNAAKNYVLTPLTCHFRLDSVPRKYTSTTQLIDHALKAYHQFNAKAGVPVIEQRIPIASLKAEWIGLASVEGTSNQGLFAVDQKVADCSVKNVDFDNQVSLTRKS